MSDVRYHDEILMQTVRETSTTGGLTSVSIDVQMQIAKLMGIEVGGADKAAKFVVELTNELGLSSGGKKLVMMNSKELLQEDFQTSS